MVSEEAKAVTLLQDEEIIHDLRPSWSKWGGALAIGVVTTIFLVGFLILGWVWLARKNSRYVVTNQRIIEISGILGTSTTEYRIADIRQLQTGASWGEKFMGHGNLQFSTGGATTITFHGIPDHQEVANTIRELQRESE